MKHAVESLSGRCRRGILPQVVAVLLVGQSVIAAEPTVTKTNWTGFQGRVALLKLEERRALILLNTGSEVKAFVLRAEEIGLLVRRNKATNQWATGPKEAMLPRDIISSVRFTGKMGRHGLLGGLAGAGAGLAIIAGVVAASGGIQTESAASMVAVLLSPVWVVAGTVAGYHIGRAADKPAPTFIIEH